MLILSADHIPRIVAALLEGKVSDAIGLDRPAVIGGWGSYLLQAGIKQEKTRKEGVMGFVWRVHIVVSIVFCCQSAMFTVHLKR
mmetsp:Transcript_10197/g.26732  ORF Transcript_10197/g.26732 Transcript_10197/m.26732 type:complete len:84 (+) Transcript_10197:185-436(+)